MSPGLDSVYYHDLSRCMSILHMHPTYGFFDDAVSMSNFDMRVSSWFDAVHNDYLSGIVPFVYLHPAYTQPHAHFYTYRVSQPDGHPSAWLPVSNHPDCDHSLHTSLHPMPRRNAEHAGSRMGDVLLWMRLHCRAKDYHNVVSSALSFLHLARGKFNQIKSSLANWST